MYECIEMYECCFKFEICKILDSIVQEGSIQSEPIAYGGKGAVKVTFPELMAVSLPVSRP